MENYLALSQSEKTTFISKTYGWMGIALLISAASAFFTANSIGMLRFLFGGSRLGFFAIIIAEFLLVMWLSASIRKLSVGAAAIGFVVYSVLNGITLSSILLVYTASSIATSLLGTAVMFGIMAFYGITTKKDLTTMGRYCMMGLIGIIISSLIQFVVSLIFRTSFTIFDFLISIASVVVFTGLTAYDNQKIVRMAEHANGSDDFKKISILAALELYLDFINLFLALLRLFGKRK